MKNTVQIDRRFFPHAVPVANGFVVHHGKKLADSVRLPMMFNQNLGSLHDVCLHNGKPHSSEETYHYTHYMSDEQAQICSELCMHACSSNNLKK